MAIFTHHVICLFKGNDISFIIKHSAHKFNSHGCSALKSKQILPNFSQKQMKYFKREEFNCTHTGNNEMDDAFLKKLDEKKIVSRLAPLTPRLRKIVHTISLYSPHYI